MQEKFDHKIKELFADEKLEHSDAPVMLQNVFDALEKRKNAEESSGSGLFQDLLL